MKKPRPQHHSPGDCYERSAWALEQAAREHYEAGHFARGDSWSAAALYLMRLAVKERRSTSRKT